MNNTMATPLHAFLSLSKKLAVKPLEFWPQKDQVKNLTATYAAIGKLKGILEKKNITDSHAYKAFGGTHIMMMTSHANDPEAMKEFQKLSDKVIGGIADKGNPSQILEKALRDAELIK